MSPASTVIDVVIGLSFVYLLLSVFCSAVNEALAAVLALRQASLRRGIETIVSTTGLQQMIYDHPLIQGLSHGTWRRKLPSYVPAELFAAVLQDVLSAERVGVPPSIPQDFLPGDPEREKRWTNDWAAGVKQVNEALAALSRGMQEGKDFIEQQRKAIGGWFDAAMARVSGAYKRQAQVIVACLAVVVCAGLNADSLAITRALWRQPQLRSAIADKAAAWAQQKAPSPDVPTDQFKAAWADANARVEKVSTELSSLGLPIGWVSLPHGGEVLSKVLGLVLTMVAVSLGAPFWFDLLNKFVNLRATGAPPVPGGTSQASAQGDVHKR